MAFKINRLSADAVVCYVLETLKVITVIESPLGLCAMEIEEARKETPVSASQEYWTLLRDLLEKINSIHYCKGLANNNILN